MSRTPETVVNKTAKNMRDWLNVIGVIAALIAIMLIFKEHAFGTGFIFGLISGGCFFVASKIKVFWHKTAEAARYR